MTTIRALYLNMWEGTATSHAKLTIHVGTSDRGIVTHKTLDFEVEPTDAGDDLAHWAIEMLAQAAENVEGI